MSNGGMNEPDGVLIGQAAALFGLAPSTLRWWESQRVLPEPPRVNGRRVYTEPELRRIGLAYLCCVTGAMPLDQASVVTAGTSRNQHWRATVQDHAELIEKRIAELRSAQAYLRHLLLCPDDDIVNECPDLDDELRNHTPLGPAATESLVAAAQRTPTRGRRDETITPRDENAAPQPRCAVCASPFTRSPRGRRRTYCSRACQQRHYRQNANRG
ncbi:MerR family DNA-binding transcriptional regulator [Nocardia sp. NPDC058176]|uniref:MerR family DNA-binding transcriptional regulator n=1 Tax=Nocardia sp. NPDC058176 TaxID=3346368 RepID=UPI0036D7D510